MRKKKVLKISLLSIMAIFILLNVAIIIQAYSLTHFKEDAEPLTEDYKPTLTETIKMAICGMDVARPKTKRYPTYKFETHHIIEKEEALLEAWLIRTDYIEESSGMIILFHGYMEEKSAMLARANNLLRMGYDVLLVDFMGAGGSYGVQTTIGFLEAENVKSAYTYATSELKEKNIILFGFSMGAAAIMKAQHDYNLPVKGIILEAPYGTFKGTVEKRLAKYNIPHWPISDLFTFWTGTINGFNAFKANPEDYGKKITVPVLLMCGAQDQYIPTTETELIFEQFGSKQKRLKIFPKSKHESYLKKHRREWRTTTKEFLQEVDSVSAYTNNYHIPQDPF